MNRTILVGRLVADPELKYTPQGVAVANFRIAVNRPFKNAEGNNEADFFNIVVWRKLAENVANYMKKGSQVGIDGRLQSRSYDGEDGKRVYITEVVADSVQFLDTKGGNNQSNNQQQNNYQNNNQQQNYNQQQNNQSNPFGNQGQPIDVNDSDLPF